MNKVSLEEKFNLFNDHWNPRVIGELNGQLVKVAKASGAFEWHKHDNEDELFYVVKGSFDMEMRDKTVHLAEGEMIIIPRGVEHRPVVQDEVHLMLFEPKSTVNTGENEKSTRTVEELKWI